MKLKRTTYRLELRDGAEPADVFDVEVILADLLRAELEGPRHGITSPTSQSIHTTLLWLWAASARTGKTEDDFQTFKATLTNFEIVKSEGAAVQGVPPTGPAGELTGSPSPSPATMGTPETPARGSSS